jgi:hypothetical protein
MERQAAEHHESILEKILPIARRTLLDHTRQTLAKPSILVLADRDRLEVHIVEESGLRNVLRKATPLHGRVYRRYDACDDLLACVVDSELITEFRIPLSEAQLASPPQPRDEHDQRRRARFNRE